MLSWTASKLRFFQRVSEHLLLCSSGCISEGKKSMWKRRKRFSKYEVGSPGQYLQQPPIALLFVSSCVSWGCLSPCLFSTSAGFLPKFPGKNIISHLWQKHTFKLQLHPHLLFSMHSNSSPILLFCNSIVFWDAIRSFESAQYPKCKL